ncbi:hypothetical protein D9756_005344 [Leucocoprinus leucothites]|uniref:Zn(2)-C6 fungal-type domain-containing protein n=1 Tax=Leucocoprinus leucothites TaxID=201217 RepID=A0A8H5FYU1_9AGAR|nr:hypothetical protein D9756_005344 [Leucoagaricus leucothites]
MQLGSHPPISIPAPIVIPSAPILPEHRLVFGSGNKADLTGAGSPLEEPPNKKRKKDRACDYCRRRKIKCDGPWRQGQVCTNCIHGHRGCTYLESSKPRGPPKAYVTSLEDKVERLEDILKQLCPNTDFSEELGPPIARGSWKNGKEEQHSRPLSTPVSQTASHPSSSALTILTRPKATPTRTRDYDFPMSQVDRTTHLIFQGPRGSKLRSTPQKTAGARPSAANPSPEDSEDESAEETVETGIGGRHQYGLNAIEGDDDLAMDSRIRFHGRSSTAGLVEVTRKFKQMCMQEKQSHERDEDDRSQSTIAEKIDNAKLRTFRRLEFWTTAKWETDWTSYNIHAPSLITKLLECFPPESVANELLDLFFCQMNIYLPLLHRPTFERYWRERLHHENVWFATLCILMFAVASRWYDLGGEELKRWAQDANQWKAAGWRWFFIALDVHCSRRSLSCPATLLEIQTFVLMVLFLRGTTCVAVAWLFVSIGIRKAQDRGAHRRTVYRSYPNADDELWKRAFWILLAFDHVLGASLGRGIATGQEDYDLDFPLEVDDEYWDTSNARTNFKQPNNIPSKVSAFNHFIKLTEIIAFAAKTLYPVDKRKVFFGFIKGDWTAEVVRQLKMALEEWVQKIPPHLRWETENTDPIFSRQAASIHSLYYCVAMTVWRPFCPYKPAVATHRSEIEERQSTAMSQCATSIKACAAILEVELQRGLSNHPNMINVSLVCAGTLAIILYVLQRKMIASGQGKTLVRDYEIEKTGIFISDLFDAVDVCMKVLTLTQPTWEYAEFVIDQLKAALPPDRNMNFESLDIPMPPVQGISDVMRVPGHLGSSPPAFQIPSDATFSFTDHGLYQVDSSQAGSSQRTSANDASFRPSPSHPYPNTIHSRYAGTPYMQNPPVPSFSDATRADYPTSLSHRQSAVPAVSQYSQSSSSQLAPYSIPAMTQALPNAGLGEPWGRHPSFPSTEIAAPRLPARGPVSGKTVPTFPGFGESNNVKYSNGRIGGLLPSEPVVDNPILQVKDGHLLRTRTTSLVDEPLPVRKEYPYTSSSLRRTSFPNLQAVKSDGYAGPLGTLLNKSLPNSDAIDSAEELGPSEFPNDRRLPPLASNDDSTLPDPRFMNQAVRPRTKSIDRTDFGSYTNQSTNKGYALKPVPSTSLKSWTRYPSPPPTSNHRYTQHHYVHENLPDR